MDVAFDKYSKPNVISVLRLIPRRPFMLFCQHQLLEELEQGSAVSFMHPCSNGEDKESRPTPC